MVKKTMYSACNYNLGPSYGVIKANLDPHRMFPKVHFLPSGEFRLSQKSPMGNFAVRNSSTVFFFQMAEKWVKSNMVSFSQNQFLQIFLFFFVILAENHFEHRP